MDKQNSVNGKFKLKKILDTLETILLVVIVLILLDKLFFSRYNMPKSNRVNQFVTEVQEIARQSSTQAVADSIISGSADVIYDSDINTADAKELDLDGLTKNYKVEVSNSKIVKIIVFDDNYCWAAEDDEGITPSNIMEKMTVKTNPIKVYKSLTGDGVVNADDLTDYECNNIEKTIDVK